MFESVVLFGAGASYGAGGIGPCTPPLGTSLIEALTTVYPKAWGGLGDEVLKIFRNQGFEAGMGWVWENMPHAPQRLQKCLGYLFSQFYVSDPNICAYYHFLGGLKRKVTSLPIMLATLNYELILEESLILQGIHWHYLGSGVTGSKVAVAKPHGSCNFISGGVRVSTGASFHTMAKIGGPMRAISRPEALNYCGDPNNATPPAMVAFMEGKPTSVCLNEITAMQEAFSRAVLSAKKVSVIGVNPNVADTHIWDAINQTDAEVVFCGDQVAFESWRKKHRQGRPARFTKPFFAEALDELIRFS